MTGGTRGPLVLAMSSLLAGCLVLPVPPHYVSARRDIDDAVPIFIVTGETTRADVLLTLGSPDVAADDQSEFLYLVLRTRAGIWITYGWREYTIAKVEYRLLRLSFDDRAVVANASVSTGLCDDSSESARCGRVVLTENGLPGVAE